MEEEPPTFSSQLEDTPTAEPSAHKSYVEISLSKDTKEFLERMVSRLEGK